MGVQVKGLNELQAKLNQIPNKTMSGVKKAIEIIYDASQPLVPVDTGRLKRSGKIIKLKDGYKIHYRALNPKNKYNYAPIQHENLKFNHRVGQAKYLEQAVKSNMDKIKKVIAQEVVK